MDKPGTGNSRSSTPKQPNRGTPSRSTPRKRNISTPSRYKCYTPTKPSPTDDAVSGNICYTLIFL